jgi:hypothetical protein
MAESLFHGTSGSGVHPLEALLVDVLERSRPAISRSFLLSSFVLGRYAFRQAEHCYRCGGHWPSSSEAAEKWRSGRLCCPGITRFLERRPFAFREIGIYLALALTIERRTRPRAHSAA